jgi:REP element-mobilizing transposase RayT
VPAAHPPPVNKMSSRAGLEVACGKKNTYLCTILITVKTDIMSYVQLLIHAVVRTHRSQPTLPTDDRTKELYQIMWGIIKHNNGQLYRINSMDDHVHILFTLSPNISLADFMQKLKASSSKQIKTRPGFEHFYAWSEGYAALSYSLKDKDMLVNYIINQQIHHQNISSIAEYRAIIQDMGLEFDERDWNR